MANPFVKSYKYFMSWFGAKVDEKADPKIQIQQAIEDAQRQHQALAQQAASVIGNQRQLELKLNRQLTEVEKLQGNTRQALILADKARAEGDAAKAQQFEDTAQTLATKLVAVEEGIGDLKNLHQQSAQAADQARQAVEQNASMLQQKLAERTKLLSQLEQAKMQEKVSASLQSMSELAAPGNVPSFGEIQEKIERRYATALGSSELASNSVEGRLLEVQKSTIDIAGASRLEEIRASLAGGTTSSGTQALTGSDTPAVEAKPADPAATPQATSQNASTPQTAEPS